MAQTIAMGDQVSATPAEAGVPRLLSADDFDRDVAAEFAAPGNLLSLRVDLAPLPSVDESDPVEHLISAGDAGDDYTAALKAWPEITREGARDGVVGGGAGSTSGALVIVNERFAIPGADDDGEDHAGERDAWVEAFVWTQRPATLAAVARRETPQAVAGAPEIVAGPLILLRARTSEVLSADRETLTVGLTDLLGQLDRRIQTVRLAGTGGLEGGEELAGARPQIVVGEAFNVTGHLVTTQPYPTYLVHRDREGNSIQGVPAAYVGGNPLSGAQFEVETAADSDDGVSNIVRVLSGLDDTKDVTFDVVGPVAAGSAVADFLRFALANLAQLDSDLLDGDQLSIFRAQAPFRAGWVIGPDDTYRSFLDAITAPWAWWQQGANGKIGAGLSVDPDLDFVSYSIPTEAILLVEPMEPAGARPGVATGYRRNWHPVSESGVTTAALDTERGKWSQQPHYRIADPSDDALTELYPSDEPPRDFVTPFVRRDDAEIAHGWISSLFSTRWRTYRVVLDARGIRYEPNRVVEFAYPRWSATAETLPYRIRRVRIFADGKGSIFTELIVWRVADVSVLAGDSELDFLADENGNPMRLR